MLRGILSREKFGTSRFRSGNSPVQSVEENTMSEDTIFKKKRERIDDFAFNGDVANVFDDMLSRSVPFYHEIQRMISEMVTDFAAPGSSIYDLGCSTGTTLMNLDGVVDPAVKFVGVDYSPEMLEKCRMNFAAGLKHPFDLVQQDLNQGIMVENASVVIMCLTLQFVRPLYREQIIQTIYNQLNPMGCLILVEKILGEDTMFNRLFIKYYYEMKKRNNYTVTEITQKREALENVLIPYKLSENIGLLGKCGFRYVDTFFKWYNFTGIVAVK
jgi:tRNA (cmo5U34)-methyltransferase